MMGMFFFRWDGALMGGGGSGDPGDGDWGGFPRAARLFWGEMAHEQRAVVMLSWV
jgi:hypothetical protein